MGFLRRGPGDEKKRLMEEGVRNARRFIGRYGNASQTGRDAINEGPKFLGYLQDIASLGGCDEIKSLMEGALREKKMYCYNILSTFYNNNCSKGR